MKKIKKEFKRICSMFLVAAMIVASVPDMGTTVFAANENVEAKSGIASLYDDVVDTKSDYNTSTITDPFAVNFNITARNTVENSEAVLEQVKVQSLEGDDLGNSVTIEKGTEFSFHLEIPEGYTVVSISPDKSQKKWYKIIKDYTNNNYTLRSLYTEDESVCLNVVIDKIQDKELYLEYPETIASVEVFSGENPVEIKDNVAIVSNTADVTLKVHPVGSQIIYANYESEADSAPYTYSETTIETDGTYFYELGRVVYNTSMVFTTAEAAKITFDVGEGISGYYYGYEDDVDITQNPIRLCQKPYNFEVHFSVNEESLWETNRLEILSTSGEEEPKALSWNYDEDAGDYWVKIMGEKDTTISFRWVSKKVCNVAFDIESATVCSFYEEWGEYFPSGEFSEDSILTPYAGEQILFGVRRDSAYTLEYVSPTGNKEDALQSIYTYCDGYIYDVYLYTPTEDTTIHIKAVPRESYEVTLDLENVTAYPVYNDGETYYPNPDAEWENGSVYAGNAVMFAIRLDSAYKLQYVSPTGKEEDKLEPYGTYADDYTYYIYRYVPTADTTIYVKAVAKEKYNLRFDMSNAYVENSSWGEEPGFELSEGKLYEGKYYFGVMPADNYKVELVTTTGDESGRIIPRYNGDYNHYQYTIDLTSDTTITIKTTLKEQYSVQLEGEHITIENVVGSIDSIDNIYTVYEGENLSFEVTPDTGYELSLVSVTGDASQTIYPISNGNTNTYVVKVTRDMVIKVDAVEKTAYTVSFDTTNVTATSENPMDNSGNYIAYANEPFVFTVTADENYVVDKVMANGETLQPLYNPYDESCYYEVVAEDDLAITVTGKEVGESELCFTYCGNELDSNISVWSEDGQSYTLSAGYVTVPSNANIWFSVAGDQSSIAKVVYTNASQEVKTIYKTYDSSKQQYGYYLGNITEDAQVDIIVGDTYRITFSGYSSTVKFVPLLGKGALPDNIYVPIEESFDFKIAVQEGNVLNSIKISSSRFQLKGSLETGVYQVVPNGYVYHGANASITVKAGKAHAIDYVIDYPKEDAAVSLFVGEEQMPLVNNAVALPSTEAITIKVKPLTDKLVELEGCYVGIVLPPDTIEEDGTQVYRFTGSGVATVSDGHFTVNSYDYNTVEFQMENVQLELFKSNQDGGYWVEADKTTKVKEGEELKFRLVSTNGYKITNFDVTDETAGKISEKTIYNEADMHYYSYYSLTPLKDAVVQVETEVIPYYQYNFEYDASMVNLYFAQYEDDSEGGFYLNWYEGDTEYRQYKTNTKFVAFRAEAIEGYKITLVSTNEDGSNKVPTTYDWSNDLYYYYLPNTADTTITIKAEPIQSYELTFEYSAGIEGIDIEDGERGYSIGYGNEERKITLSNKNALYICPCFIWTGDDAMTRYIVTSVKANGVELTKGYLAEYDISGYVLPHFNEDTTIVIETAVNEAAYNTINFEVEGDENSCEAGLYVFTDDGGTTINSVLPGNKLYVEGKKSNIAIKPTAGYAVTKVEFIRNGKAKTLSMNEEGTYYSVDFPLSRGLQGTLKVYTVLAERIVHISGSSEDISYTITESEGISKDATKEHTYCATTDAEKLKLEVAVKEHYIPTISYKDVTGKKITLNGTKGVTAAGKVSYSFEITLADFGTETEISISQQLEKHDVKLSYNAKEISVKSITSEGQEITETKSSVTTEGMTEVTMSVPYGKTIQIKATALNNCNILKAVLVKGEKEEETVIGAAELDYAAVIDMSTTITVLSEGLYQAKPLSALNADGTKTELNAQDGVYWVDSQVSYLAGARYGVDSKVALTKVEILRGNVPAASTIEVDKADASQAKITIAEEDAGKTLTVNLYANEAQTLVATYTLRVYAILESVTVEGVADGKVSQTVDTAKDYKLTLNPARVDASQLGVEVVATEGKAQNLVKAEIIDGVLRLTTASGDAVADAATVKLYNRKTSTTAEKDYVKGGTFTVSTVRPLALEEGTVKVELQKAYDVALALTLTAPEGVEASVTGKQYYKVVITPQASAGMEIPEEIKKATEKPYYVEKEAASSQNAKLLVSTKDYGDGQAWKFDVKASLVQTKDGSELDDTNENEKVIYRSKESTLNNIATKDPYYEVKLTLKKKAKQIYTTQENVAAVEVVFSKDTSFADIEEVKDITALNGKGSALTVWEKDGVIYASATADTMVGKHTIEATAYGPESMNKTKATIVVTVVKGIESIEVSVPSVSVYKPANKAVTVKATVSYNAGMAAPKTKKATWEIVNAYGEPFVEGDALYGMLTVKNGKVSVSKSFVPTETETDNQFRVKVNAADFEGNTVDDLSEIITLTSQPAEIGAVYVVAPTADGFEVVVKEGSVITTDKLKDAFVVALKKDVEEKAIYTAEELAQWQITPEILTYKSSNKAVAVEKTETEAAISASKTAKNVKLTVSTNDGGKKNAVMKFTVAYATPKALALEILDTNQTALSEIGAKEVTFAGTTNTRLVVKVKQKNAESWEDLNALVNYKLSVKNGKLVASDNVNGIYEVLVTAKTATITLDNKTTGSVAKDTYQVTNTAYSEAKAPKAKTSSKLIAGILANRTVTYTLSGAYDYQNKYVLVETDWTDRSKKAEVYSQFEAAAANLNTLIPISSDGKFTLTFAEQQIPAGNYKLKLTFGTGADFATFVADAKPVTVTLKAANPKVTKGSFKPTNSYKLDAKAGASVVLTGKGKNIVDRSVVFYDLKNANIKGQENEFLSYFELRDNTLYLKSDLKDEQLTYLKSKAGKNDLIAYVSYTASYGDDGYGNPYTVTGTTKLTIKLK